MPAKSTCETVYYYEGAVIDDRYALQEFLGEGGMACVYRARELHAPNPYAIKFLKSNFSNNPELISHFGREAQNMKDLAHPNIVRFYDFIHHPEYAYILMDYVEGFSLSTVLKKLRQREEQMPLDEAVRILTQVARGIDKIHRANFIHRDIKPGNILIAKQDGTAYVADLGIMVDLRDETLLSIAAGTRAYMPPEQQIGERVDKTADIYAFGILAFELFAGQRPYVARKDLKRDEAENDLIRQHFESAIPSISQIRGDLPSSLDPVIAKAIAKRPIDRYQSVLEFARDIHKALAPRLSEDLQDFSEIRPIKPQESYYNEPVTVVAPPTRQPLVPVIVGLVLLGLALIITGWVISSVNANNAASATSSAAAALLLTPSATSLPTSTHTVTSTPTETSTNTPTATLTPSSTPTNTSTPSLTPTATNTPTATTTPTLTVTLTPTLTLTPTASATFTLTPTSTWTPQPVATTSLDGAPLLPLVSNQGALGLASNVPLTITANSDQPLIQLSVGIVNGFQVAVVFPEAITETTRYGIAYRVQDNRNYLLFTVDPSVRRWLLEQITNGLPIRLDSGDLGTSDLTAITISGQDDVFRIEMSNLSIQATNETWLKGGLALWVESDDTFTLDSLSISLLGDGALTPLDVLRTNAQALLETGDISSNTINCPAFITLFDGLNSYRNIPELTQSAQQLIDNGQLIYLRCEAESPQAPLSFSGSLRDFLSWQNGLRQLIDELSSS